MLLPSHMVKRYIQKESSAASKNKEECKHLRTETCAGGMWCTFPHSVICSNNAVRCFVLMWVCVAINLVSELHRASFLKQCILLPMKLRSLRVQTDTNIASLVQSDFKQPKKTHWQYQPVLCGQKHRWLGSREPYSCVSIINNIQAWNSTINIKQAKDHLIQRELLT